MLATCDKATVSGFVLADWWSDNSPGTQARASESGTCGSVRLTSVPFFQRESQVPYLALRLVPVAQVPLLRRHQQSVLTEIPLWPPSPPWISPPVLERSYRESETSVKRDVFIRTQRPLLFIFSTNPSWRCEKLPFKSISIPLLFHFSHIHKLLCTGNFIVICI